MNSSYQPVNMEMRPSRKMSQIPFNYQIMLVKIRGFSERMAAVPIHTKMGNGYGNREGGQRTPSKSSTAVTVASLTTMEPA